MTTFRARSAFAIAATIGLSAILTFGPAPAMAATAVGARLAAANGVYLQEDCDGDGLDDDTGLPIAPPAAPTPTPTQAAPSTQAPPPPDTGASSGGGADTGSASAGSGGEPPSGGSSGGEGAAPPPAAPTEQAPAPAPTPTAK
ncbi:MAG: hypothetical protein LBJ08_12025, partial [Bifidobacteriaceae bacterium]|nr:hypothetical protein [Bifidobacteriaceae bacterium]